MWFTWGCHAHSCLLCSILRGSCCCCFPHLTLSVSTHTVYYTLFYGHIHPQTWVCWTTPMTIFYQNRQSFSCSDSEEFRLSILFALRHSVRYILEPSGKILWWKHPSQRSSLTVDSCFWFYNTIHSLLYNATSMCWNWPQLAKRRWFVLSLHHLPRSR